MSANAPTKVISNTEAVDAINAAEVLLMEINVYFCQTNEVEVITRIENIGATLNAIINAIDDVSREDKQVFCEMNNSIRTVKSAFAENCTLNSKEGLKIYQILFSYVYSYLTKIDSIRAKLPQ